MDDPNNTIRFDDVEEMYLRAEQQRHELDVLLVDNLLAAGIEVKINTYLDHPVAVLPARYEDALEEALADRRNRDEMENFYRDYLWGNLPMPAWPEGSDE